MSGGRLRRLGILGHGVALASLIVLVLGITGAQSAPLATLTVNSTNDVDDGTCDLTHCSLREAINAANATDGIDTIDFDIAGAGDRVIQPTSALPSISRPVVMDGSNHLDGSGLPLVRIDGSLAGAVNGPTFSVPSAFGSSLVQELAFTRWASGFGMHITSTGAVLVRASIFGTNAASASGLTNGAGVNVGNASSVGGTALADRNYVVGGATGIATQAGATIQGNWIGVAPDGSTMGASIQGVRVDGGSATIGGFAAGSGNLIRGNGRGVFVQGTATGVQIQENSIDGNSALGIDLGPTNGVTPNDAPANLDADTGPNGLQNFPMVTAATATTVSGELDSAAGTSYTIDVYASPTCDASGNGEGATHVASFLVTTNGSGHAIFTNEPLSPTAAGHVTATATGPDGTSEFSACQAIGGGGPTPQPGPVYTVNDNSDLQPFDDVGCTTTECTLREAIQAANTDPADNTIEFDIVGDTQVALSGSGLPPITDTVVIDGTSQEGISVNGDGAGNADGFILGVGSDGSTIKGLEIRDFGSAGAAGIRVLSPNNIIQGNHLWAVTNGIVVGAGGSSDVTDNTIGGDDDAGEGNRIWDFASVGVRLDGAGTGNKIQGNTIGLDLSDGAAGGNTGIYVANTPEAVIGANAGPGDLYVLDYGFGNVVAGIPLGEGGNGIALTLGTTGAVVAGNFIGTDRDGAEIGNVAIGINVSAGSADNQLGPGNTIAHNVGGGIDVSDGDGNRIVANSIYDNGGSGISLSNGNGDLPAPTLTAAETAGGGTATVNGSIGGATGDYFIEFFKNGICDQSESGEGEEYVGFANATIVEIGSSFVGTTFPGTVAEGDVLTATSTSETDNTSEFSNCVTVEVGGGEVDPPVLTGAVPDAAGPAGFRLGVAGVWDSGVPLAGQSFNVTFYSGNVCTEAGMTNPLGSRSELETNSGGIGAFAIDGLEDVSVGTLVGARVDGSDISNCVVADRNNVSWPTALELDAPATDSQNYLRSSGQGRWFKVPVVANSRLDVRVSGLPADYDLVVFKDIQAKYDELVSGAAEQGPNLAIDDLNRQGADTPVDLFNTSLYNPSSWDPTNWKPDLNANVFSPQYSPTEYSPTEYSAAFTSPTEYSPTEYSPTEYSPTEYSPTEYSPTEYSADQYSTDEWAQFTPADPRVFSVAQTASLVAVSAGVGTGDESVSVNTWNNTGHFYVRVQGKNGSFDGDSAFSLQVSTQASVCSGVLDMTVSVPSVAPGNLKTLVLTSSGRGLDVAALSSRLSQLASHGAVAPAAVVDVSGPLAGLNLQADQNPGCPYAKNLVAAGVKNIVDAYRDANPTLAYLVVVGGDDVIPFYRYPDPALLGNESLYVPPVGDSTASQASLRLGYVLSDDFLASSTSVSLHGNDFPVPDLAIGRLVETQSDIAGMLDSFLAAGGSTLTPTTSLVTGYDFLADAATDIKTTLATRVGGAAANHETLITNRGVSPGTVGTPPTGSWTALDLRRELLAERNDLVFLAGHFSANDALAADYRTNVLTTELAGAPTSNFEKAIVFSAGCHAGYNIVNGHAVPGTTQILDWAQAFAQKKATLIAGTGYQYGDTDFLAHSERIYAELARQLGGPVGSSLLRSKQIFLEESPGLSALDEKALLQTTLFGLPMLSVNLTPPSLPGGAPVDPDPVGTGPGAAFGLEVEDAFPVSTATGALRSQALNGLGGSATWFEGTGGKVAVKPMQPVLPLQSANVTASGRSLRGVLFTEGSYTDATGTVPLTAAPATELRGIHAPFLTDVFFPPQPWTPNYFGALSGSGSTKLHVTPVQHRSESPEMTRRKFSGNMEFRLFYTGQIPVGPGLSAPPTITGVDASHAGNILTFSARVVGAPNAGIQEVWVTYTNPPEGSGNGSWVSIPLSQDEDDPTLWTGTLTTTTPGAYHFMVQAVSGVGRVTVDSNLGAFYRYGAIPGPPDPDADPPASTSLDFQPAPPSPLTYGASFDVTVDLDGSASCVDGKRVRVDLGGVSLPATTDASGTATIEMRASVAPGIYPITATFAGDAECAASDDVSAVQVLKQPTALSISFPVVTLTASTTPQPTPLHDRTVTVKLSQAAVTKLVHVGRTDPQGRVEVPAPLLTALPAGTYAVTATYEGEVGYLGDTASGSTARWPFTLIGLSSPPALNTAKAGTTVPVKFSIGANRGLAIFAAGYPSVGRIDCASRQPLENPSPSQSSGFRYDSRNSHYTYDWKTDKSWTGCRQLVLRFTDGTEQVVYFRF